MVHKNIQMMDAGSVMFQTTKPYGIVIGGVKREIEKQCGQVLKSNEFSQEDLPETCGECDLFADWSSWHRLRAIACRLDDAGIAGTTEDGEEIHRYCASFKEGNANTVARKALVYTIAGAFFIAGIYGIGAVPRIFTIAAGTAVALFIIITALKPSTKAQKTITSLKSILTEAK